MSTDRLEVRHEETNNETLEQSAEKLKADGVDINKDLSVNANGEGIKVSEPKTEMQSSEERPEWLPEKFTNAEELAKAYTGLEKEFSSRTKEEVKPAEETKTEEAPQQGLDIFYEEFADTGELSEKSYAENIAGGKEEYTELMEWASTNLTAPETKVFNDMVDSGDIETAKFAVQGLISKSGANPKQPSLFEGTSDAVSKDAFASIAQVTEAMNDPRYDKDPAYRKLVEEKIGRSTVF